MIGSIEISVVMSVYNTNKEYLVRAIESILSQTFSNFEFIIIDDKSTDGSLDILQEYEKKDARIVLIKNSQNIGLTKSLNIGLQIAKGKYVARMDADDISLPYRLEKQYEYMEKNPSISAVGAYVFISENVGLINRGYNRNPEIDKIQMLFRNAGVAHPTAMFRKRFLEKYSIMYDESLIKSQDYGIWYDIVKHGGVIGCIPEILLRYRVHDGQISVNNSDQMKYSDMVTQKGLENLIGIHSKDVLEIHCSLIDDIPNRDKKEYLNHLKMLILHNNNKEIYIKNLFIYQIWSIWLRLCMRRIKYNHKIDFLFSKETLHCCSLPVLKTYYETYIENQSMYKRAKKKYLETAD